MNKNCYKYQLRAIFFFYLKRNIKSCFSRLKNRTKTQAKCLSLRSWKDSSVVSNIREPLVPAKGYHSIIMCKWRISNNWFILFSLNCQKIHSRGSSSFLVTFHVIYIVFYFPIWKWNALAGNRTRASRMAGENSTAEPPVPCWIFADD